MTTLITFSNFLNMCSSVKERKMLIERMEPENAKTEQNWNAEETLALNHLVDENIQIIS